MHNFHDGGFFNILQIFDVDEILNSLKELNEAEFLKLLNDKSSDENVILEEENMSTNKNLTSSNINDIFSSAQTLQNHVFKMGQSLERSLKFKNTFEGFYPYKEIQKDTRINIKQLTIITYFCKFNFVTFLDSLTVR